jgi:pyrroline-5-carboxylate reductase
MGINIACIGSGNMGFALMKNAGAGVILGISDVDPIKAKKAAAELGAEHYLSNIEAAEKGDFIFLAVKPQVLQPVLEEIAPVINGRLAAGNAPALVSMAAGWPIKKIQAALAAKTQAEKPAPVARIMPNTPALVSKGMIALAASPELPPEKIAVLSDILKGAGVVDCLEEKYLDAVTGLSGSGPAFVYIFIEALADGGVRAGLPRDKALSYAAQTVLGAAAMVQETGRHPGELKDMVTSPGGTTIAGLAALEKGAFRGTVIQAVEAAWRRSGELG